MPVLRRKNRLIVPLGVAIVSVVGGGIFWVAIGSQTKESQCHRLIEVVNQGSSLIEQNKGKDVPSINKLAQDLDKVTKDLNAVYLGDVKLKDYRDRFVKVFQDLSHAIADQGQALDSAKRAEATLAGRQKVEKAKTQIEASGKTAVKAAEQSEALAGEVNRYCSH